ncbi:MAG: hypothetical protein PHW37_03640, partial [Acholeplasmataceae bacterium]|nr:hypothetical protein [Acholeplasmataceae bacterium]
MKITVNDKVLTYDGPVSIEMIAKDLKLDHVLAANVNGRLRELAYILTKDQDITFLGYDNADAVKIYESTMRYVVAMALKRLHPNTSVKFNYSISRSILAVVDGYDGYTDDHFVELVEKEVKKIIASDLQIKRQRVSIGEAMQHYQENGMLDKVEILKYREEDYVNLYACDGYANYMFGYMLPSTGYLNQFHMFTYHPGFIIQVPRAELDGQIPQFVDEPSFGLALKEVAKWGKIIQGNTIPKMNEYASDYQTAVEFVNMCETKHNHQLNELGNMIQNNIDNIRLIAVAGPSSSGKTTFTTRLRIELMSRGIKPVMISIDDYYLLRELAPKNEDGTPDLEHVDALDVDQFNRDMLALIRGQEVTLPHFDFKIGKRKPGKTVRLKEDT